MAELVTAYIPVWESERKKLTQVKSNIVESLELPQDIVYGAVIISAMGRNEVLIENYKGIIDYTRRKYACKPKPVR